MSVFYFFTRRSRDPPGADSCAMGALGGAPNQHNQNYLGGHAGHAGTANSRRPSAMANNAQNAAKNELTVKMNGDKISTRLATPRISNVTQLSVNATVEEEPRTSADAMTGAPKTVEPVPPDSSAAVSKVVL